jgi:hypothetical protein
MQTDTDLVIEGSTATWTMSNVQGLIGGTYNGTFKLRCFLSPTEELGASRLYRELLGPHASLSSEDESYLAYALTQLKYRVISAPPFWYTPQQAGEMPGSIPDKNVLLLVLDASARAAAAFQAKMTAERDTVLKKTIQSAEDLIQQEGDEDV